MTQINEIPLPKKWPEHVKSTVLHTISLASTVFTAAHGWTARRTGRRVRLQAALEEARSELALLREEMSIKDARFGRVHSYRRPYDRPIEVMRILKLKAARGWSTRQAAAAFMLNEQTVSSWLKRVSRLIVGFAIFPRRPSALDVCAVLDRIARRVGRSPKYTITDQDAIFTGDDFKKWCKQ